LAQLVATSFEPYIEHNGNHYISKTDLKNTIKHIFDTYNELLFFRIRNGKITHKYYIFNVGSPKIDWYKDLKFGGKNSKEDMEQNIKHLQQLIIDSNLQYYMTFSKPYFLRANGCLLGFEMFDYIKELKTSYVREFLEILNYSCDNFTMFDCDIIINRKDFAYITKDNTYSYNHLLNKIAIKNPPKKWYPVFSQCAIPSRHLDIPIPSADEWNTINNPPFANTTVQWHKRVNTAFFRGQSTGCGTTTENNTRLKFAEISKKWEKTKPNLIDIGISGLTSRFKAFEQQVSFVNKEKNNSLIGKKTDYVQQMKYKYIFNIPGNSQAYRFPTEFYKGAVIINVENRNTPKMWFEPLLEDGVNYVKLYDVKDGQEKALYEKIKWLNDE
jgi:hypothetical protein